MSNESRKNLAPSGPDDFLSKEEIDAIVEEQSRVTKMGNSDRIYRRGRDYYATVNLPAGIKMPDGEIIKSVTLKQISGETDLILGQAQQGGIEGHKMLDDILVSCIHSFGRISDPQRIREIITGNVLLIDYIYMMFKIRQNSLGDSFKFSVKCPNCGHQGRYKASIGDLELITMAYEDEYHDILNAEVELFGEPWRFKFHFGTQGDAKYLINLNKTLSRKTNNKKAEKRKARKISVNELESESEDGIDVITGALLSRLDAVWEPDEKPEDAGDDYVPTGKWHHFGRRHKPYVIGDVEHMSNIASYEYLLKLPQAFRVKVYMLIVSMEPAFDMNIYLECDKCEYDMEFPIHPQDPAFFYPSEIDI